MLVEMIDIGGLEHGAREPGARPSSAAPIARSSKRNGWTIGVVTPASWNAWSFAAALVDGADDRDAVDHVVGDGGEVRARSFALPAREDLRRFALERRTRPTKRL